MEEFLEEFKAKAIEGLDVPEALICIRTLYIPRLTGEWYVELITASGLVLANEADNCHEAEWVENPSFMPDPDHATVPGVPTPDGSLDEDALYAAAARRLAVKDLNEEELAELTRGLRELGLNLEDLERIPGAFVATDGLNRTAHLWKRSNIDLELNRSIKHYFDFLLKGGAVGRLQPISIGVYVAGDDSVEQNLDRFLQQDEVHVLDPLEDYDMALCVSASRLMQLADVPGVERLEKLVHPPWANKTPGYATHTPEQNEWLAITPPPNKDINLCRGYVFFAPR